MKKSQSSYDLALAQPDLKFRNPMKYPSSSNLAKGTGSGGNNNKTNDGNGSKHKVVIYFSDAYNNICNNKINGSQSNNVNNSNNIDNAARVAKTEMQSKATNKDFMAQLKTVLEEKSKFTNKFADSNTSQLQSKVPVQNKFLTKPALPEKPSIRSTQINQSNDCGQKAAAAAAATRKDINEKSSKLLPSFIESIDENNVIKLKIEQNFKKATELVSLISSLPKKKKATRTRKCDTSNETSSIHELNFSHEEEIDDVDEIYSNGSSDEDDDDDVVSEPDEGYFYDWSFVQEWRSR